MRTGKHISSIAYHRPEFFKVITDSLRKSDAIGPAIWIAHKGEKGDKPHIHLLLIGGFRTYNTSGLEGLWGFDIEGDEKRSVSSLWRTTKNISDWLLYGLHEPRYMAFKGLEKDEVYDWSDFQVTAGDEGILSELRQDAIDYVDTLGDKTTRRLIAMAKAGRTWQEVVISGIVPMGQLSQAHKAWQYIIATFSPYQSLDS